MSSKYKVQKQTKAQQKAAQAASLASNAKNQQRVNQMAAAAAAAAAASKPANGAVSNYTFKPTDTLVPSSIREMFPDSIALHDELKKREKQLDLLINKKLLDLQDYQTSQTNQLIDDSKDNAILRIFVYNTSENQPWQKELNTDPQQPSYPPSWTLRIEGRLLDGNGNEKPASSDEADKQPQPQHTPKFSTFLSSISVEFHAKDGNTNDLIINSVNGGPNSKIVEWHDSLQVAKDDLEREQQQFDGLDIKRGGSSIPESLIPEGETVDASEKEIVCDILIQPKLFPVKLQIVKEGLVELLGCNEITQHDCFTKIFNYIKNNNLFEITSNPQQGQQGQQQQQQQQHPTNTQDPKSSIILKTDDLLYRIFETDKLTVPQMMDIISTKLLKPIQPIKIQTSINTLTNSTLGDIIIDLKVNPKLINPKYPPGNSSLQEVNSLLNEFMPNESTQIDINKLKSNISLNLQLLNFNKLKYDFYKSLADDPINFLEKFQKNNSEYLKILASDSVSYSARDDSSTDDIVDEERIRRSDYYTNEFVSEHISLLLNAGRL